MNERKRIPILDTLVDGCRMLPETIQGILFFIAGMSIYSTPYWLWLGIRNFILIVIIIEVILILILAQKNFVFRRISKIENAISHGIVWLKTKQDAATILRYFIFSSILFLIGILVYSSVENEQLLLGYSLVCVLYFLKGLFYVPLVQVKIIEDEQIQFINDFNGKCVDFKFYEIQKIEIQEKNIRIFTNDQTSDFKVYFYKKEGRMRLRKFLEWYLPKAEIR
ncbi:MAG: hypothetical protein AB8F94_27200 [Saprospiraceae bacterium]